MSDEADRIEGLRTRIVRVVRESTGLHERFVMPIAAEIIETFRKEFGGERLYMPSSDPEVEARVLAEFNGRNREEVIKRNKISRATFYRILQRARPGAPDLEKDDFQI